MRGERYRAESRLNASGFIRRHYRPRCTGAT
jgi:hypothetical protein